MKAKEFLGFNITIAKDQPEYTPLPAFVAPDGTTVVCFELSQEEREKVMQTGEIWMQIMTFGGKLQPIYTTVSREEVFVYKSELPPGEIKQMILLQEPEANAQRQTKTHRLYIATLENGLLVCFQVPFDEMGDCPFGMTMPAQLLMRWLVGSDGEENLKYV